MNKSRVGVEMRYRNSNRCAHYLSSLYVVGTCTGHFSRTGHSTVQFLVMVVTMVYICLTGMYKSHMN